MANMEACCSLRPPFRRALHAQLGLKFPKAGAPAAVIDTGAYEERALLGSERDCYPLVIRMETISDKGRAEAHTLQARRPPCFALRPPPVVHASCTGTAEGLCCWQALRVVPGSSQMLACCPAVEECEFAAGKGRVLGKAGICSQLQHDKTGVQELLKFAPPACRSCCGAVQSPALQLGEAWRA